jgi:hypothetical protein
MRRRLAAATAVLSVLTLATACSGDDGGSTEVKTITVTLKGDSATPAGDRVDVDVDQPVDVVIKADRPGQIHVHSSPEQYFEFKTGTNEPVKLQFDRPGKVEIEFHEPIDAPIVELLVR